MFQANVKGIMYTFYHTTDIVEILQKDPEYRQLAQALARLLEEEEDEKSALLRRIRELEEEGF